MLVASAKETTKINKPDEFDFEAILVKLSQCCKIVYSSSTLEGFVHLIKKPSLSQNSESETLNEFFNKEGFLLTDEINSRFKVCIQRVLEDRRFWENQNVFDLLDDNHVPEKRTFQLPPRVCATLSLRINRSIESPWVSKLISLDIVPCIHIDNWWPNCAIPRKNWEEFRSGCNLVFDQPQRKYPWIPYSAPYGRISFAPLESQIIIGSPIVARAAYMVAKQTIQKAKHSYILKTALLYCLEVFENRSIEKSSHEEVSDSELNFWVGKLSKCYLLFCFQDFVPCYFIPDFHLPFTDYAKSNHDLLKILGVDGDNGWDILQHVMESRNSSIGDQGYCAKICNVIDGILDVFEIYWSVCDDETEVKFNLPNPEIDPRTFRKTELLDLIRSND